MITQLTKEQEARIQPYIDEGLKFGLEVSTDPLDVKILTPLVSALYGKLGFGTNPLVVVAESPRAAAAITKELVSVFEDASEGTPNTTLLETLEKRLAQVGDLLKATPTDSYRMWGCQELYWIQLYRYIQNELPVEKLNEPLEELFELCKQVGWFWPYDKFIVISNKPRVLRLTDNRLHCVDGPAIEYGDGLRVYAINGVHFGTEVGEEFVNKPASAINLDKVLGIKNVEQRSEIIKKVGIDKLFDRLKPKLLDTSTEYGYALYSIEVLEGSERRYLKMNNPSVPGETHIEAVHPDCRTVAQALNWRNVGTTNLVNGEFRAPIVLT